MKSRLIFLRPGDETSSAARYPYDSTMTGNTRHASKVMYPKSYIKYFFD